MMHVVDYYPTLAGLAGATLGKNKPLDGVNVWPTLSQGRPTSRNEIVYNIEMFRGAVRRGDWKLFWRTTLPSKVELYNLAKDPSEKSNLASQNPQRVRELQNRVQALSDEMAKSLFLTDTFKGYLARPAQPMALPNDDSFFLGDTP